MGGAALGAVLLMLLVAGPAAATTTTIVPADVSGGAFGTAGLVTVAADGYAPGDVAVVPGAEVRFSGDLAAHPVLFDDGPVGVFSGTSFLAVFPSPGHYTFHGPATDATPLSGSVYVAGPVAHLRATQVAPPDPRVRLDASGTDFVAFAVSSDNALYEFDINGDDVPDSSGANPIVSVRFPGEGTFSATVRVTDNSGFSSTATTAVVVTRDDIPPEDDTTPPKLAAASFVPVGRRALRRGTKLLLGTPSEAVTATATLLRGSTVVARASQTAPADRTLSVQIRASAAGRRLLLRRRPATLTLRIVLVDAAGNTLTLRRTVRVRGP